MADLWNVLKAASNNDHLTRVSSRLYPNVLSFVVDHKSDFPLICPAHEDIVNVQCSPLHQHSGCYLISFVIEIRFDDKALSREIKFLFKVCRSLSNFKDLPF
jgi:hypothetical protein